MAVNSFRALQNDEAGVKRVSCEARENNENKYAPRYSYVCYIEIDFAKDENVFLKKNVQIYIYRVSHEKLPSKISSQLILHEKNV